MGRRRSDPIAEAFRSMFPDPDLESYNFTPIHKAVLELSSVSLTDVISLCSRETMNQPDRMDMTPLMWAAYRGDLRVSKLLLLNGADLNKATAFGSALHFAARAGSHECVNLLLQHGADPNEQTQYGHSPLYGLIYSKTDDVTILDMLYAANVKVDRISPGGGTPLSMAVQYQQPKIAARLIRLGANIHHCEPDGSNSIYMATHFNLHDIIRLLLDGGADHIGAVQVPLGPYLHLIAHAADLRTLEMLTNALAPRDIYFKRRDGMTALDVARTRKGVDSSWHNAFNTFIGSVYRSTMVRVVEEDDAGSEVFADALERQP